MPFQTTTNLPMAPLLPLQPSQPARALLFCGLLLISNIGANQNDGDPERWEIVGVVGDVRHSSLTSDASPELFLPYLQNSWSWGNFLVRTKADPAASARAFFSSSFWAGASMPTRSFSASRSAFAKYPAASAAIAAGMAARPSRRARAAACSARLPPATTVDARPSARGRTRRAGNIASMPSRGAWSPGRTGAS